MSQTKQSKKHRRREMAMRATLCRQQAISKGYRYVCPLIDVLADYASVSERLPWPSQVTMAREAGVTDRTIRNWLSILEGLGLVEVFRSKPKLRAGEWSRQTNRYLLCSRRATGMPWSMPVRQRRNPRVLPTGNEFPVTREGLYRGGADNVETAPTSVVVEENVAPTIIRDPNIDWRQHSTEEKQTNRRGIADVRERLRR